MKKVFLYVVMTCLFLSGNVFSQENKSGFVTTLSAQYGLEKRAAFELGYQASDAYFYLESSIGRLDNEYDVIMSLLLEWVLITLFLLLIISVYWEDYLLVTVGTLTKEEMKKEHIGIQKQMLWFLAQD